METPGPRYLAPAIPFLAVVIAAVWSRAPRVCLGIAAFGTAIGMAASFSDINTASTTTPWSEYLHTLGEHVSPTLWSMALGRVGVVVYVALIVAALVHLARVRHSDVVAEVSLPTLDEQVFESFAPGR